LLLSQASGGVLVGGLDWSSPLGYQRFSTGFVAGAQHGFAQPIYFTGEQSSESVLPAADTLRQAGVVAALAPLSGEQYSIPGMGRLYQAGTQIVPGPWGRVVALTGDAAPNAPAAQLYMYVASDAQSLLQDQGQLYAFVSDDPSVNDYSDLRVGTRVAGRFSLVPREIALDDQAALEAWSNENNAFQFIRTEDIAVDKNNPLVVYVADSGEPRAVADPGSGRLARGPSGARGLYPNGRIFKLTLDASDPLQVDSFEILVDADAAGYTKEGLHNPASLDTSGNSLIIQEKPVGANIFNAGEGPAARIWRYNFQTSALSVIAEVDQSADPQARLGSWDTSGVVNAAALFGPGTWLVNVRAHSLWVQTEAARGYTRKLEGGQLLLLIAAGS
jgi:hypothetical protein